MWIPKTNELATVIKKDIFLHFRLFTQVCERMCHVYGRDDTTKIADHQQNVEQRHKNLATDFTKRRNEIQAMQNSFTSFDNSVERFLNGSLMSSLLWNNWKVTLKHHPKQKRSFARNSRILRWLMIQFSIKPIHILNCLVGT